MPVHLTLGELGDPVRVIEVTPLVSPLPVEVPEFEPAEPGEIEEPVEARR